MLKNTAIILAAIVVSSTLAVASGPRAARRTDAQVMRSAPAVSGSSRHNGHRRDRPVQVIIAPLYHYYTPYPFIPQPVVVNAPFFCVEHRSGFISRIGLIDHLGGTHKLALRRAAAICPEDVEMCVFDGF
ncbi:MAG: hypothetical protein WD688_02315 [Candidatus Binatia bacterium]